MRNLTPLHLTQTLLYQPLNTSKYSSPLLFSTTELWLHCSRRQGGIVTPLIELPSSESPTVQIELGELTALLDTPTLFST